jgi:hypothetical protein
MKKFLPALAALISVPGFSQITVTQADMPSAGDSMRVSFAAGVGSIDHTLSGPNYYWDFSSLMPVAQQEYRFDAPSAIPFNFLSTLSFVNPSPDSLPIVGNVPTNFTDYFKNGSSGYRQNGISFDYAPLTSFSIPVVFSQNDYVYRFPLNYGDIDSSDAAYAINFPPLPYIGQTIHRENNVDGWGTLITPYGTFMALRVVSAVQRIDTVGLDSVNGFSNPRPLEMEYKWLTNGMKIPILEVDAQILFNTEVVTNVVYRDIYRSTLPQVGVEEQNSAIGQASVYPNPSSGSCYISFDAKSVEPVSIILTDISGRQVMDYGKTTVLPGMNSHLLDLNGIAPGAYLVNIISGDSRLTRRIIISN